MSSNVDHRTAEIERRYERLMACVEAYIKHRSISQWDDPTLYLHMRTAWEAARKPV